MYRATLAAFVLLVTAAAFAQTQIMMDDPPLARPIKQNPPKPEPPPPAARPPEPPPRAPDPPPGAPETPLKTNPPLLPPVKTPEAQTEAGARPPRCVACAQTEKNIRDLQALVSGQLRMGDLTTWRRNRGLVQMPTRGDRGNIGPCGSFHYNPDKSGGELVDNYANPLTACAFMSLLQDWKKQCPESQKGCRVAWGDISHRDVTKFNGHSSHTHGNCIDIRPMRRGGFDNAPLVYQNSDRETTAAFIRMAKAKGATPVLYNDPRAGASYSGGHDNHMHVCFHNNAKTKQTCANYKYDADVCGPN